MRGAAATSPVQVLERMMARLEALAGHARPASLKQLAADTGLHPSAAHRIPRAMVEHRLGDHAEPGTYRLGIRLLELGHVVKARLDPAPGGAAPPWSGCTGRCMRA